MVSNSKKMVKADPITISGFDEFSFAVHKISFGGGQRWAKGDGYAVTEISTGLAVCSGFDKDEAVRKANLVLKNKGVRKTRNQIKSFHEGNFNPLDHIY